MLTLCPVDPFQLLTFAGIHTTCHGCLKCCVLGDAEEQSFYFSCYTAVPDHSHSGLPAGAKAHGKEGVCVERRKKN